MKYAYSVHKHATRVTTAAIVNVVALAFPAQAAIVYHATYITINNLNSGYNLDLNGDGVTDFTLGVSRVGYCQLYPPMGVRISLRETASSGNGAMVGPLTAGTLIGPTLVFSAGTETLETLLLLPLNRSCGVHEYSGSWHSPFAEITGFLGLSVQHDGQTYYGWAKLRVFDDMATVLLGYAYETTSGMSITAGETDVNFTPSSLHFGTVTVGNTASRLVTLKNQGTTPLIITSDTLSGPYAADFHSDDSNPPCTGSVAVGATCTLTFTFTPSIAAKESATFSVHDTSSGSPQKLTLSGTGQ